MGWLRPVLVAGPSAKERSGYQLITLLPVYLNREITLIDIYERLAYYLIREIQEISLLPYYRDTGD